MKVAYDFLCLDERDSPNLAELRKLSRKEIKSRKNKRHFGLCGVIVPGANYPDLNIEGRKLQSKILKGRYLPFHYVDILNASDKWAFLGADRPRHESLKMRLNNLVKEFPFKIVASFVCKEQLVLSYGVFSKGKLKSINRIKPNISAPTSPKNTNLYLISLKFIMQKFYLYLKARKKRGLIIAEARGEKEDMQLLDAFYQFQHSGVGSLSGRELRQYLTDLLIIRKSQNHIGCQLADLITYPIYDYYVEEHSVRNDHFIRKDSLSQKILEIDVFPASYKKGASAP